MKTCSKCGAEKPLEDFYFRTRKGHGRHNSACKSCDLAHMKARYDADPEIHRARGRANNIKFAARIKARRIAKAALLRDQSRAYKAAHPEKVAVWNAAAKAKQKADPLHWRKQRLRQAHGMTLAEYELRLTAQGGVCAICGGPPVGKDPFHHVDHDHESGATRGLLCGNCNLMIGLAKDDPAILESAIAYLRSYEPSVAASA